MTNDLELTRKVCLLYKIGLEKHKIINSDDFEIKFRCSYAIWKIFYTLYRAYYIAIWKCDSIDILVTPIQQEMALDNTILNILEFSGEHFKSIYCSF